MVGSGVLVYKLSASELQSPDFQRTSFSICSVYSLVLFPNEADLLGLSLVCHTTQELVNLFSLISFLKQKMAAVF